MKGHQELLRETDDLTKSEKKESNKKVKERLQKDLLKGSGQL